MQGWDRSGTLWAVWAVVSHFLHKFLLTSVLFCPSWGGSACERSWLGCWVLIWFSAGRGWSFMINPYVFCSSLPFVSKHICVFLRNQWRVHLQFWEIFLTIRSMYRNTASFWEAEIILLCCFHIEAFWIPLKSVLSGNLAFLSDFQLSQIAKN